MIASTTPRRYILLGTQEGVLGVLDVVTANPYYWSAYVHTGDEQATRANLKTLAAHQSRHPEAVCAIAFPDDKYGPRYAYSWAQGGCCETHMAEVGGHHHLCETPTPDWHVWGCGMVQGPRAAVRYIGPHAGGDARRCVELALASEVRP